MYSRGITGQYDSEGVCSRIETQHLTINLAESGIKHFPGDVPGQAVQYVANLAKHTPNLSHIISREDEWHSGGCRNLTHIIVRSLRGVAEGQGIVSEVVGGAHADFNQLRSRKCRKSVSPGLLIAEVASDQAAVGLTDFNERLAGAVMRHASDVEALVGLTFAQYGGCLAFSILGILAAD